MKFLARKTDSPTVLPTKLPISFDRKVLYVPGGVVELFPETPGLEDRLRAEVVEASPKSIKVRALHDFHSSSNKVLVTRGAEFEVEENRVHNVSPKAR